MPANRNGPRDSGQFEVALFEEPSHVLDEEIVIALYRRNRRIQARFVLVGEDLFLSDQIFSNQLHESGLHDGIAVNLQSSLMRLPDRVCIDRPANQQGMK